MFYSVWLTINLSITKLAGEGKGTGLAGQTTAIGNAYMCMHIPAVLWLHFNHRLLIGLSRQHSIFTPIVTESLL